MTAVTTWLSSNLWKIVVMILFLVASAAVISEAVRDMKPKVALNTKHRHVYEEKVNAIETRQQEYHQENLSKLDAIISLLEK